MTADEKPHTQFERAYDPPQGSEFLVGHTPYQACLCAEDELSLNKKNAQYPRVVARQYRRHKQWRLRWAAVEMWQKPYAEKLINLGPVSSGYSNSLDSTIPMGFRSPIFPLEGSCNCWWASLRAKGLSNCSWIRFCTNAPKRGTLFKL